MYIFHITVINFAWILGEYKRLMQNAINFIENVPSQFQTESGKNV